MVDGTNPFLITPPPGLLPPPAAPAEPQDEAETPSITLPGIVSDSATVRVSPPREPVTARPPAVGFPFSTPGAAPPAAPPTAAPPATAPPTAVPPAAAPPASAPTAVPAPGSSPAPAPAAPPAEPDNDATRVVAVGSEAAPTWRLTLPSGETVVVDGALFLGRNPTRAEGDLAGALLPLADETKSVSKTHALLTVDAAGLWVTDLDSTNGVYVALPEGDGEQAEPGERLRVPAGSDIVLGEFVIQVERG